MRLRLFRFWRDPEPDERAQKTEEVIQALRKHREENHLGEAFRAAFAARYQGDHRQP